MIDFDFFGSDIPFYIFFKYFWELILILTLLQ